MLVYTSDVLQEELEVTGPVKVVLYAASDAFLKGHRIRVLVASSHFPQFDRNPNTGATFGTTGEVKVAQQTVYHDADHPSHIVLPVIPPRGATTGSR